MLIIVDHVKRKEQYLAARAQNAICPYNKLLKSKFYTGVGVGWYFSLCLNILDMRVHAHYTLIQCSLYFKTTHSAR